MKKNIFLLLLTLLVVYVFSLASPILAAKKRVWGTNIVTTSNSVGKFSVSARFSGWKQYLNISFKGVAGTKGVTYQLIYASKGIDQGLGGSVKPSEGNVTRQVFLGTCSHGACTAHKNISDVRLTVIYTTLDGQNITKNYKVKY